MAAKQPALSVPTEVVRESRKPRFGARGATDPAEVHYRVGYWSPLHGVATGAVVHPKPGIARRVESCPDACIRSRACARDSPSAGAGSLDRRCWWRLNLVTGADSSQDPSRPLPLPNRSRPAARSYDNCRPSLTGETVGRLAHPSQNFCRFPFRYLVRR